MEIYGKTPKSWLSEVCAKKKLQLANWAYEELQKIPSKFMSTCVITRDGEDDIKVQGIGNTKKEADHSASQKALEALNITMKDIFYMTPMGKQAKKEEQAQQKSFNKTSEMRNTTLNVVDNTILSDDNVDLSEAREPVGDLITLCQRNKISNPLYEEAHECIGSSNKNIFTVTCAVGSLTSKSARCSRKVDAKKVAAFRVLKELENMGYKLHLGKTPKSSKLPQLVSSTADSSDMDSHSVSSSSSSSSTNLYELKQELNRGFAKEENVTNFSSSSSSESRSSANLTSTQVDGNPLKRELDIILGKVPKKGECNSPAEQSRNLEEDQRMQIDIGVENFKRKLLSEEDDELNADSKRKRLQVLELLERLGCQTQDNSCLQFISNYCHIFQHLPTGSIVENALGTDDLMRLIKEHGGPLTVLQKEAIKLKIKMSFTTSINLQGSNGEVVFLKMKLPRQYDPIVQRQIVVNGVGKTKLDAKVNAAYEALGFLNLMIQNGNVEGVPPPNIPYPHFPFNDLF